MGLMKTFFGKIAFGMMAALAVATGQARADLISAPSNGNDYDIGYFGGTGTSYYAQSFLSTGGNAVSITFGIQPYLGNTKFDVLLTTISGNFTDGQIHPETVLFESGPVNPKTTGLVTVSLGNTPLAAGVSYAWIIDSKSQYVVGPDAQANADGSDTVDTGNVGHFFYYNSSGGTRADDFADGDNWGNWGVYTPRNDTVESMAFDLTIQAAAPVPEPSSFALLGLGGLGAAIAAYRRRRAAAM